LIHVASQGSSKEVKDYTKKFEKPEKLGVEDLIKVHKELKQKVKVF
jgi:hypothetical protein